MKHSIVIILALILAVAAGAEDAPVRQLPQDAKSDFRMLGDGVVGKALPAEPIDDPSKLLYLEPGEWEYEVVAGPNKGDKERVRLERAKPDDPEGPIEVVYGNGDVQHLRITRTREVMKTSQVDGGSDRRVVYRPGIVLDPKMKVGDTKTLKTTVATYKGRKDRKEYDGQLEYRVTYHGAFEVTVPAGRFQTRLLEHEYDMTVGPAESYYRSYGFYADDVGCVAEASEENVTALILYRRSSRSARVLLVRPEATP